MATEKQPTLPEVYLEENETKTMARDPLGWGRNRLKKVSRWHVGTFLNGLDGSSITAIGLYIDLALAFGEGIVGLSSNSHALLADSAHSFGDSFMDLVTLLCITYAKKPANLQYPHGYGKYETLGSVLVSFVIMVGAIAAASSCIYSMLSGSETQQLNGNAAWCAFASIVVKEWLFQKSRSIA